MKIRFQRLHLTLGLVATLVALATLSPTVSPTSVYAGRDVTPPDPADSSAVAEAPSLHNPTFDNGIWYEFNKRYSYGSITGVWLPDGNYYEDPQDWRLWFKNGTDIVDCDPFPLSPSDGGAHTLPKYAQFRTFENDSSAHQVAGLYQVVANTTPCFTYQFQMYGRSRQKEEDDWLGSGALNVGIDPKGWDLNQESYSPAVSDWPATMVWGTAHAYTDDYGPLVVTAEALNTQITVFSYADAYGGNSHKIHWDTGSLVEVPLTDLVPDPEHPTINTSKISSGPTVNVGSTSATVNWQTSVAASGQVYYRFVSAPTTPISSTGTLSYTVYLPLIGKSSAPWLSTTLNPTPTGSHTVYISNLLPGGTYEYLVASRGVDGNGCITWVAEGEFTLTTQQ